MTTITKFITITVLSMLLFSCKFDLNMNSGVKGNGNVMTIERNLDGDFDQIEVSAGMNVYLRQTDKVNIAVEADENLHDVIITKIEDGVLKITTDKGVRSSKKLKIMVDFIEVNSISSSSGSDVYSVETIVADNLKLNTSSGADMEVDVRTKDLQCSSSSGSDLVVTGRTDNLIAEASSGSDLEAKNLIALTCRASASSGSDISVNTSKKLVASASSGGDVNYYGDPETVEKSDSSSGSVHKK